MVNKFAQWIESHMDSFGTIFIFFLGMSALFLVGVVGAGGCAAAYREFQNVNPSESTANAIPAAVQSYEVPIADTSIIPDTLYLRPGQSAILLEDIVANARIPAQGAELYVGPVVLQRGTVVVKPKVEK